jgi:hypothetical protein
MGCWVQLQAAGSAPQGHWQEAWMCLGIALPGGEATVVSLLPIACWAGSGKPSAPGGFLGRGEASDLPASKEP